MGSKIKEMTIRDFLANAGAKQFKKYDGEIGLEIETETRSAAAYPKDFLITDERTGRLTAPSLKFWDVHNDGSLRNFGVEYVLKQPVKYKGELSAALEEFSEKTAKVKFDKDSISTSVHVHLNMLNEKFKTLGNFFTLYSMFENILVRYSGPDRLSNLFCLPICDAEQTYHNMKQMIINANTKNYRAMLLSEGNVKYAALNLSAFNNYGSIEIRTFRGETDIDQIHDWVSILYKILEYSRKDISPKDIMLSWKEKEKKFLNDVFQEYRKNLEHKDEMYLIDKNLWYAASVAYCIKDWNSLDQELKIPEFKPKQKELEFVAQNQFGRAWINLDNAEQEWVVNKLRRDYETKFYTNFKKKSFGIDPGIMQVEFPVEGNIENPRVNNEEFERIRHELLNPAREQVPWGRR